MDFLSFSCVWGGGARGRRPDDRPPISAEPVAICTGFHRPDHPRAVEFSSRRFAERRPRSAFRICSSLHPLRPSVGLLRVCS